MSARRPAHRASADSERAPSRRAGFDRLLAEASTRLANAPGSAVEREIARTLDALLALVGADRCTFSELDGRGSLNVICSVASQGLLPFGRGRLDIDIGWLAAELEAGRVVAARDIEKDLPAAARGAKQTGRALGVRSHLSIPITAAGRVVGALSLGTVHSARPWAGALVDRLRVLGELCAGALERMRLEAETRRLRQDLWQGDRTARIGLLTSLIAREINQPLTAILSNAQAGLRYLDRGALTDAELRAILEAVVQEDKRAAETLRAMRGFLRRSAPRRRPIALEATVRQVLQLLEPELRRHDIDVELQFAAGGDVQADRAQIQQVLLDLLMNALAAMQTVPREQRRMLLSVSRPDAEALEVAVRDSGEGIPAEDLDAVFDPFWTKRGRRVGLGLALCRSIVEAHGGSIRVDANPDRGVTFRFTLPSVPAHADAAPFAQIGDPTSAPMAAGPAPAGSGAPNRRLPWVCIVERDGAARSSVMRLIRAAGWSVAGYPSWEAFVEMAPLPEVACLLVDPIDAGLAVGELRSRLQTAGASPHLVVTSVDADMASGIDAMKHGAVDVLPKPLDDAALLQAVRLAVERHDADRRRATEKGDAQRRLARLTEREREVIRHVVRGRLNKQIAADLGIAEQTVKQHRGRALEKLGTHSLPDLVHVCEAGGLV